MNLIHIVQSDLFDQFPFPVKFDYIFVNPPFVPRYPEKEDDFAFCCGELYEYYIALFDKLNNFLAKGGKLIMALAKSCEIDKILEYAEEADFRVERIGQKRKWSETNYLFQISYSGS